MSISRQKVGLSLALCIFLGLAGCTQSASTQSSDNFRKRNDAALKDLSSHINDEKKKLESADTPADIENIKRRLTFLETKLEEKRTALSIGKTNQEILQSSMDGHTQLYPLNGRYRVMVIPVQFQDAKFVKPEFFVPNDKGVTPAQEYLFGSDQNSMTSYYKHSSSGKLKVEGEVTPAITVDGNLVDYGEAVEGENDKAARELVKQALLKLKAQKSDAKWWSTFDRWDLGDYDADRHYYEPDGFIDAVVLIYAGKAQSSCQRSFDPNGERPPSSAVPPGPRHDSAVECFNRIWPHRWSISIGRDDPNYQENGPVVEGIQRPSMNGLKITDEVFALDYNMQSEFSDLATFIHEFGHSLSLPDIYASEGENSTGSWEVMSSTSNLQAQEMSTYSKLSLGWMSPKIVKQGQDTTAYLGVQNFVTHTQRETPSSYAGPTTVSERVDGETHEYDIVSKTPDFGEAVYKSIAVLTDPSTEEEKIVNFQEKNGDAAAYSGRFDANSKALKVKLTVPETGDATLRFDMIHHIETETNFEGNDSQIKVVTDFDLGTILINGQAREELRLVSGDANFDTLAEANPACEATRVLELRLKRIANTLTDAEKEEFEAKTLICQQPVWVEKSYDLSGLRGQTVELEIRLVTDAGYTEFGIVVDNVRLGNQKVDYETPADETHLGDFEVLKHGTIEKLYHQFYLLEYRSPTEEFVQNGTLRSYNMDNHIQIGRQAMFMNEGANPTERFRVIDINYQSGLVVWYFNSKYDRRSNSSETQDGKGYLLVLNSKIQEMKLPGPLSASELFDENGHYDTEKPEYKLLENKQRQTFACFGFNTYYQYLEGEAPHCEDVGFDPAFKDAMKSIRKGDQTLVYRREGINEYYPLDQYALWEVDRPLVSNAAMRTALSVFRPESSGPVKPYTVYKVQENQLVLDDALTAQAETYAPVSSFSDKENKLTPYERFLGDSVVVEKRGLNFKVVEPSARITESYSTEVDEDGNANNFRRPRVKVLFQWDR